VRKLLSLKSYTALDACVAYASRDKKRTASGEYVFTTTTTTTSTACYRAHCISSFASLVLPSLAAICDVVGFDATIIMLATNSLPLLRCLFYISHRPLEHEKLRL